MGLPECLSHPVGSIDTARAEVREWKQPWKWAWNRPRNYTRMGTQGVSSALQNAPPKSGALVKGRNVFSHWRRRRRARLGAAPSEGRVDQKNLRFKPDYQSFEANRGAEGERSLEFGAHAGNWIRPSWAADTSLMPFS